MISLLIGDNLHAIDKKLSAFKKNLDPAWIGFNPTFRRCGSDFFICCENLEAKRFWAEIMQF